MPKLSFTGLPVEAVEPTTLHEWYQKTRRATTDLCRPLAVEDHVVQSMPDVSPTKWHLAHTSWFFETFVLERFCRGYRPFHSRFREIFNSYYNSVGPMHTRGERGLLSRPTVAEVYEYRTHVDEHMAEFLVSGDLDNVTEAYPLVVLGLNHEQQHQELLLTDLKHVFSRNPLFPSYHQATPPEESGVREMGWIGFREGLRMVGYEDNEFCFDNELPPHREFQEAFRLADRLVTNAEYLEFMEDGGYSQPEFWLSDGWAAVQCEGWEAPLYWVRKDGEWFEFTLRGLEPLLLSAPVCHVSYYEAEAYAHWSGHRLPREGEWETAAADVPVTGNLQDREQFHPRPVSWSASRPAQLFGDVWEWTQSAYSAYPGYSPMPGALGEYNGKFMSGQMVLKGGSCVTPASHLRASYRNFFPPSARWQFSGIRMASDG